MPQINIWQVQQECIGPPWRPLSYLCNSNKPKPKATVAPEEKVAVKPVVKPVVKTAAKTAVKSAPPAPARAQRPGEKERARVLFLWHAGGLTACTLCKQDAEAAGARGHVGNRGA